MARNGLELNLLIIEQGAAAVGIGRRAWEEPYTPR